MSNAAFKKPTARGLREQKPPAHGRCECCRTLVGPRGLKWHHCHDCGEFVAFLCNACNLILTEHAIQHWEALAKTHDHGCQPATAALFDMEAAGAHRSPSNAPHTRRLYLSNGGGDPRYLSVSSLPGHVNVEQLAAILGINAQTARDIASGRHTKKPIGEKVAGTWFISYSDVLAFLTKRWGF